MKILRKTLDYVLDQEIDFDTLRIVGLALLVITLAMVG